MALEFFTKDGKGYMPKASVRKQGQIGLNHGAIEKFDIKNGQFVLLGYDGDKKMIAIKLLDKIEEGAKKVIVKGNSGSIAAKAFFDYFEIPYRKTESYSLSSDSETQLLKFYFKAKKDALNDKFVNE